MAPLADHIICLLATPVEVITDHSRTGTTTRIQRFRLASGGEAIAKRNTGGTMFAREHHALQRWRSPWGNCARPGSSPRT